MSNFHSPQTKPWKFSFWSLFFTQFQSTLSDYVLKTLTIFLIVDRGLHRGERNMLVLWVGAFVALPFVLFSMAGGSLAARYSKRAVIVFLKVCEIGIMALALEGLSRHHLPILIVAVFWISTQHALLGPSKHGLLPEMIPENRLSFANGALKMGTFLAMMTGVALGALLAKIFTHRPWESGAVLIGLAVVGWIFSLGIRRLSAAEPTAKLRFNLMAEVAVHFKRIRQDRVLFLAILGNAYGFFFAALMLFNIIFYGADILGFHAMQGLYLLAAGGLGLAGGCVGAGYLSNNRLEYGLIPLGSIGVAFVTATLFRSAPSLESVAINLALFGFFAGFFIVPVNSVIQHRPDQAQRGPVIALSNWMCACGLFLASVAYFGLSTYAHLTPRALFLGSAVTTLAVTAFVLLLLPEWLVRLLLWFLTHSLYRIRVVGRENLPERGGALLVSNHFSAIDGLLLIASSNRFIRFLMYKGIYDHPMVRPFAHVLKAIPVSPHFRPRDLVRTFRRVSDAIHAGQVACIFAEGQITRTGRLLPFHRGLEWIMKGIDAPIIPVHIDGVWGSIFSFERGRFLWKIPRDITRPVTVNFGAPLPPTSTAFEVRQAVQQLETDSFRHHKNRMRTLHRSFVHTARWHPFRFAMADLRVPKMRYGPALTKTVFLAARLKKVWRGQEKVGVLLPPSVAGALTNVAALLMGKIPVNLNYTASNETLASCVNQCGIQTVVTSRAFLERVPVKVPGQAILLEELADRPRFVEKLSALLKAWTFPVKALERALGRAQPAALDDLATVIFSSGSTGDPKGVLLTHYNVGSNIEQMGQIFALGRKDRILGILPLFHAFGYTVTLWLPPALGMGVVYYPNPLDAQAVGERIHKYAVTFLIATPTFLHTYLRRCTPEEFRSLQYVLVGAEKLPERLFNAFEATFGIRPLEGYGCTECSPVVSVNTRDFRARGLRQVGAKRGRIGQPMPGVSVRIVDPDTLQPVPVGEPGLLLVKGPNVMQGYLGRPDKTAEVLRDGWYITGDMVALDQDGFLTITDRLTRFSKIAGEMVPHIKVEEKLHELAGATEQTFLVTSVPDSRKGERLVVLHTLSEDLIKDLMGKLSKIDLPNLWIPRANSFFHVDALPYLGTGKMDLRTLRDMALQLAGQA